jgi:PPM family protein phosphatase
VVPVEIGSRTEVGHVRRRNEDALLVDEGAGVVVVADGLGGHPAGDLASSIARQCLVGLLAQGAFGDSADPATALREALQRAHEAILAEAGRDPQLTGMATTVVLALVRDGAAWIAHVGDSRAYVLDLDGDLRQLTRDHGMGGYLTQALGLSGGVSPDVARVDLPAGSRLLLATDGLTNMVADEAIATVLAATADPQEAADALVDAALRAGGIDNVTLVVLDP